MYRGTGLCYKIRKTTVNNKTGDNYSITIPRIIAEKFNGYFFKLIVSGNSLIFTSGCKLSVSDINDKYSDVSGKIYSNDGMGVIFK